MRRPYPVTLLAAAAGPADGVPKRDPHPLCDVRPLRPQQERSLEKLLAVLCCMGCMGTYAAAGCWVPFSTGLEGHDHEAELESLVAWNTARQKHTRRSPEQTPDPRFFFVTCPGCERKSAVSRRGRVSHGTSFLRPWLFSTAEARTSNSSSSSSSSCLAMRPPRKVRPFCFFNYWEGGGLRLRHAAFTSFARRCRGVGVSASASMHCPIRVSSGRSCCGLHTRVAKRSDHCLFS